MAAVGGDWRRGTHDGLAGRASSETTRFIREVEIQREADHRSGKKPKPEPRPIAIRPMCIDDAAYVLDSWANSYRRSQVTGPIERDVFNIEQRARINRLITRPTSRVFVACDAEDTNQIRGWVCFEAPREEGQLPILHYVCVQPAHQLQGIGAALMGLCRQTAFDAEAPIWSTHETQPMRHVRPKWNLLYNPYLLEVPDRKPAKVATGTAEGAFTPYGI